MTTKTIRIRHETQERLKEVKQELLKQGNTWNHSYNDIIEHLISEWEQ